MRGGLVHMIKSAVIIFFSLDVQDGEMWPQCVSAEVVGVLCGG